MIYNIHLIPCSNYGKYYIKIFIQPFTSEMIIPFKMLMLNTFNMYIVITRAK